jgi:GDSL-like lipase/acylhydrolase family protein
MLKSRIAGVVCVLFICGFLADDAKADASGAGDGGAMTDGGLLVSTSRAEVLPVAREALGELPKVLLIGDSISIGYEPTVRDRLTGLADVYVPIFEDGTRQNARSTLCPQWGPPRWANLYRWLGQQPAWDLIHFNHGLHDISRLDPDTGEYDINGVCRVSEEDYQLNLHMILDRMIAYSPGASTVWATTTPVPEGHPYRQAGDAAIYNVDAATVMTERGIPTNDLYTTITSDPRNLYKQPGDVHFINTGYEILGNQVADAILEALTGERPVPLPGDANRDGLVSDADYSLWVDFYGMSTTWATGDFNADGLSTDADYTIWADNYGATAGSAPEPVSVALLALGSLALLRRRGRQR